MKSYISITCIILSFVVGWFYITQIPDNTLAAYLGIPFLCSIICNWLVILEKGAVKFGGAWIDSLPFLGGEVLPIKDKWLKPTKTSIFTILSLGCAFFVLGGITKLLWVVFNA